MVLERAWSVGERAGRVPEALEAERAELVFYKEGEIRFCFATGNVLVVWLRHFQCLL